MICKRRELSEQALEKSTFIISVSFYDEDGDAVIPNTVSWSLRTIDGHVINGRKDVSETPATTVNIVLTGDDLQIVANKTNERVVTVESVYDSDLGNDLNLNEEIYFIIKDLVGIS
jgi:hypothetical protein